MTIHASMTEYLRRRAAHWRRRRTARYISNLPLEIQKDIGWPAGIERNHDLYREHSTPELHRQQY